VPPKRIVVLIAALGIATLAALSTWAYVRDADRRAYANASLVRVFRAAKDIKAGTPADQAIGSGAIASAAMPQQFRPPGAVTELRLIRGKVAVADVAAGELLVAGEFADRRPVPATFAGRIPAGQVAITVQVDQVHGVANLIAPGDKVNILIARPDGEHTLLQNVNVLAVGTSVTPSQAGHPAGGQSASSQASGLITFALPPLAAERLAWAASAAGHESSMYLTLVPPDNGAVPVPPVSDAALFSGGLTPYGP